MIYEFLAEGFEEVEAIAPVDILRRAGFEVKIAGVGGKLIKGARGVTVETDVEAEKIDGKFDMIILPGGMPGTINLEKSGAVQKAIDRAVESGAVIGAICAAPTILGHKGILRGKKAVCYPGNESELEGAQVMNTQVCEDGNIITANGPGAAFAFGLALAQKLGGDASAVKSGMIII